MRCEGRGAEEQDLTDSLQSREAAGKPYALLAGNGACDACRNCATTSSDEHLVTRVWICVCCAVSGQGEKQGWRQ